MPKVTGQVKNGDRWADEQRDRKPMDTSKTNKQDMKCHVNLLLYSLLMNVRTYTNTTVY